jgi:hypothetical protein
MARSTSVTDQPYSKEGFVVLVQVPGGVFPRREAYVVACSATEAAEDLIRELYVDEPTAQFTVAQMPFGVAQRLKLRPGDVMPWQ